MTGDEPFIDWAWIMRNLDEIGQRTVEHVVMTAIAVAVGFVISFGLALAMRRLPRLHPPIIGIAGILYAIPSLALFALLIPFTGLSLLTAEIALVSYTILILLRNILAGLDSVPAEVLEAADGMGFTGSQRLWSVELPMALPIVVAGLRIATVTTVGLVTVTSLIGQGGLGYLIVNIGLSRFFATALYVGAIGSVLLAVAADLAFIGLQRALTPWARARAA